MQEHLAAELVQTVIDDWPMTDEEDGDFAYLNFQEMMKHFYDSQSSPETYIRLSKSAIKAIRPSGLEDIAAHIYTAIGLHIINCRGSDNFSEAINFLARGHDMKPCQELIVHTAEVGLLT